jgi:hypothetical protein
VGKSSTSDRGAKESIELSSPGLTAEIEKTQPSLPESDETEALQEVRSHIMSARRWASMCALFIVILMTITEGPMNFTSRHDQTRLHGTGVVYTTQGDPVTYDKGVVYTIQGAAVTYVVVEMSMADHRLKDHRAKVNDAVQFAVAGEAGFFLMGNDGQEHRLQLLKRTARMNPETTPR